MLVQFFLWLVFFFSLSFIFLDSILVIGVFSLSFSLMVCYLLSAFLSSWFSVIAVVVYVGGLLVMFSYFLAVCPNQGMELNVGVLFFNIFLSLVMAFLGGIIYFPSGGASLTKIDFLFGVDEGALLIFLIVMLLFSLLAIVAIISLSQGPLRPFSS